METDAQPTKSESKLRRFHPTPGRLLVALLAVEGGLLFSERLQWFAFNEKKGWTVLIAVVAVSLFLLLMIVWFIVSLIFHWHFQFSIRSLLLLTIAVAIPSSWFAVKMQQARTQREAVDAIQKLGGWVAYDYQLDHIIPVIPGIESPRPVWLRKILGDDFCCTVVLAEPRDDASMLILKDLSGIRQLVLQDSQVTDTGLEHLKGLTQLKTLYILGPNVTEAGLEHIKGLTQLEKLDLGFNVTDSGLEILKGLPQLQRLVLVGPKVTDSGLETLKDLTQLRELYFVGTKVTDEGVKTLQQALPNCKIQH